MPYYIRFLFREGLDCLIILINSYRLIVESLLLLFLFYLRYWIFLAYWVEHLASCREMLSCEKLWSFLEIIDQILIKNYMLEHVIFDGDFYKHLKSATFATFKIPFKFPNLKLLNSDPASILLMVGKLRQIASTFLFC